jgi:hypothetical protein
VYPKLEPLNPKPHQAHGTHGHPAHTAMARSGQHLGVVDALGILPYNPYQARLGLSHSTASNAIRHTASNARNTPRKLRHTSQATNEAHLESTQRGTPPKHLAKRHTSQASRKEAHLPSIYLAHRQGTCKLEDQARGQASTEGETRGKDGGRDLRGLQRIWRLEVLAQGADDGLILVGVLAKDILDDHNGLLHHMRHFGLRNVAMSCTKVWTCDPRALSVAM